MSEKKKKPDGADVLQPEEPVKTEVEELTERLAAEEDRYQRVLAEYANYKRRTEQEKARLGEFVKAEVVKALLPTLDTLERAAEAPEGESYKTGVEMTVRQLKETLETLGISEIAAKGEPFDPEVHHAVIREDVAEGDPDTVTDVLQKGYRMGDMILRPAMVRVAN